MVVGRNIRLAVLVMADASVPSRRRRGFDSGSQGTVTWRFVRVIVFGRIGCHALVAAMAYSAGQQRRMLQCAAGCTAHSVATAYSFGVIRSALVPLHAWGWKMVSVGLYVLAIAAKRLWHSSLVWTVRVQPSRDATRDGNCTCDPSWRRRERFERRTMC